MPQAYLDSLAKIEAIEAEEAAAAKAAEEVDRQRVSDAIAAARADERAKVEAEMAGTASAEDEGVDVAPNIDWGTVASSDLTLFYPGQASFEWVQNGKTHGGARR